jgi:peptide/nickel transport system permease protein
MSSELGSGSVPQETYGFAPTPVGFRRRLALAWAPWKQRPLGVIGAIVIALAFGFALAAPLIAPYDPRDFVGGRLESPSGDFLLGTNLLGQDVLSRTIYGAQVSLAVALSSTVLGVGVGTVLGVLSAYYGGWVDLLVQRALEVLASFPGVVLVLMIIAALGKPSGVETGNFATLAWGVRTLSLAIAMNLIFGVMRVIRSATLKERELIYIEAARTIGASSPRIMFRHILPNVAALVVVLATVFLPIAILAEAAISFLGLGVPDPTPSWGADMTGNNQQDAINRGAWWVVFFPGAALSLAVLAFNMIGDAFRDITDPRLRGGGGGSSHSGTGL